MHIETFINRRQRKIKVSIYSSLQPKAIFIISHGASEHIARYDDFATFLSDNGIVVYGYNHLGHGNDEVENIYFGEQDGNKWLVNDLEDICWSAHLQYPDLPIIVFGHSMGSLIVRGLAIQTKIAVDGIIICGSLHPKLSLTNSGLKMAQFLNKIRGGKRTSKLLNKLAFGNLETTVSYNKDNIEAYKTDVNCGQPFTNQAIVDLLTLTKHVTQLESICKMLKTNYFIISGEDDPFSQKTKQLEIFTQQLADTEVTHTKKFYPAMKHEILNEKDSERVYYDILEFIRSIIIVGI